MSDKPALQLRILGPYCIKDDDLICLYETTDMKDGCEDGVFSNENGRDEVGRGGVYTAKISGLDRGV